MKKNKYYIIAVIVLSAIVLFLYLNNSSTTFRRSNSDFAVDDTSNVTMIFMSDKNNNTLKMNRTLPGNKWIVNDKYPGQKFNIDMLMETMLNLQVKHPVPLAAHNNIIKEMAANSVKVEVYQQVYRLEIFGVKLFRHEKLTKVYYVGGAAQDNHGTFMLMEHSTEPFVTYLPGLRGFVSPRYTPIEKYWRDYTVFKKNLQEIASIKVEFPSIPQQSFEIVSRFQQQLEMRDLSTQSVIRDFDTLKVMNFLAAFRNLNFEAILNDMDKAKKDSILSSVPFVVITLTDTAGVVNSVKTYHKSGGGGTNDIIGAPILYDPDRAYALVNDGKDFTLIQFFVFDKVLRPLQYFLKGSDDDPVN
jgi:hypothetical protein